MPLPADHARLLSAAADELMRMRQAVDGVEALIGDLIRHAPPDGRSQALIQAQALDLLNQRLDGLSAVLGDLARGATPDRAVAGLTLMDMAARLTSPSGLQAAPETDSDTGELTLF